MHDFTPKAIKLYQVDPQDPARKTRVLLSLAHIVRLVPKFYTERDGKRVATPAPADEQKATERGLKRSFQVIDDLGGEFDSHDASGKAQAMLEQIWNESA